MRQDTGVRSEDSVAFMQLKPGEKFVGEKVACRVPVELGRVVLGIPGQQTAMAGGVALVDAIENSDRLAQRGDDMIA